MFIIMSVAIFDTGLTVAIAEKLSMEYVFGGLGDINQTVKIIHVCSSMKPLAHGLYLCQRRLDVFT